MKKKNRYNLKKNSSIIDREITSFSNQVLEINMNALETKNINYHFLGLLSQLVINQVGMILYFINLVSNAFLSKDQFKEKERIEDEDLEKEFSNALGIYLPKLFSFINEEIKIQEGNNNVLNDHGEDFIFVEFSKFYFHNNLHNVFSKFNELFIHLEDKNDFWEPLGIKYIKSGVEDELNFHFYIPLLINILSGTPKKFIRKFLLKEPLLNGFKKIGFSSTGYAPNFEHHVEYYQVKFYL